MRRLSPRFLLQVGGFFVVSLVLVLLWRAGDYRLGVDVQRFTGEPSCLPFTLFVMHMQVDRPPQRGDFVVATMPDSGLPLGARPGARILKRIAGVPGDQIRIEGTELYINGLHRDRLWLAKSLPGKQPGDFDLNLTLADGQYFLLGSTQESFDSRYWGPIHREAIRGYAHPLF
ncbi:hypothetical protein Atep_31140 (plasmid) [Allochromatium tepidum]|uniref:Signal peptidase I n=1 Tax=Allochromatium tepidum TaxID=553982 RepID=A0ABM7QQW2_9GAMM|nr:hypothetical protein Atep_31140 [Allochromatium tepidum]